MPVLWLEIELESPALLAAAPPASNLTETLSFIPGNSVRGLLAHRFLERGGDPESEAFLDLFVTGETRFGAALPEGAEALPLSARTCKYTGGFAAEEGHGVVDLLLAGSAGRRTCEVCGAALDYAEGFWKPAARRSVPVETVLRTRTAIDPQRSTARTGQLFTQQLLVEGQRFTGCIEVPQERHGELEQLLGEPFRGRVGTGASRGQGWVQAAAVDGAEADRGSAAERFATFREAASRPVLVVTLLADALFRDVYLRDRTAPSPDDLAPLGVRPEDWEPAPERAFADVRTVFGFDGEPVRLPRSPRTAVVAGSSFLFAARDGAEPVVPGGTGVGWVGDGQREGYGRAMLWHPFHLGPERSGQSTTAGEAAAAPAAGKAGDETVREEGQP